MRNSMLMTKSVVGRSSFRSALGALILSCFAVTCYAQSEGQTIPHRGFQPTDSYALGNIETINTTNGNLMLNIPLASLPAGRGSSPGFQLALRYNSKIWNGQADVAPNPQHPDLNVDVTWLVHSSQGGWDYNLKRYSWATYNRNSGGVIYPEFIPGTESADCRHFNIWKMKVTFPDGGTREFRPYGNDDECDDNYFRLQPAAGMSYYSTDGTYARLDFSQSTGEWTIYFADGTRVVNLVGSQRTYDRNGNYTEIQDVANYNNTGHTATLVSDQLGRSITVERGTGEDYVTIAGVNGATVTTTVKWLPTYVKKTYRAGNHFQYNIDINNQAVSGVSEIILPVQLGTNLKYLFGYNGWPTSGNTTPSVGWGEVSSVTMPSGASANYQYKMDNQSGSGQQADWVLKNAPTRKDLNYNLEYDGSVTPAPTETSLYSISESFAQITSPDGGITKQWFTDTDLPGGGLVYKTEGPDGSVVESIWKENRPYLPPGVTIYVGERVNSYLSKEFVSIRDAAGTLVKTAIKEYRRDKNGNLLQQSEYDWAPYSSVARDGSGNPTGSVPVDALLQRVNTMSYYCATPDASDTTTNDPESYDKATAPLLRNAPASAETGDGSQTLARTEFFYDNALSTGNLTQQKSWDSTKGGYSNPLSPGNSISVSQQYDGYANRTLSADARGYQTKVTYGSVGGFTDLYPTQVVSAFGTSIQRTLNQECDFNTGLVTRSTDVDNNVSSETDYDALGRPVETRAAANVSSVKTVTRVEYSAVNRRVITRSDLSAPYDGKLVSIQHYDQMGRIRLARQLEDFATQDPNDEAQGIKVQTRYKYYGANSYQVSSHPYREASSSQAPAAAMGWSRAKADNSGRLMEMQQFGGNSLPAPWSSNTTGTGQVVSTYDANTTTVMDQAGKVRRSVTDGLGRLVRVDEPDQNNNLDDPNGVPFQSTSNSYDTLDNLTSVLQGTQTRTFVYDSLKRLTSAANPESGTIAYQYDNNGNLTVKTDARGVSAHVSAHYAYDALNRPVRRWYNGSSSPTEVVNNNPALPSGVAASDEVNFYYDSASLPSGAPTFDRGYATGRLVAVTYGGGSAGTYRGYDALGRVIRQYQQTDAVNYLVEASYNVGNAMTSETYPSAPGNSDRLNVNMSYDDAGRLASLSGGGASLSQVTYTAHGALAREVYGNNLAHTISYNNRLQVSEIKLATYTTRTALVDLDLVYNYGTTNNNGNLQSETYLSNVSGLNYTQNFSYDSLNRLATATETAGGNTSWTQSNGYDRYGNRGIDLGNGQQNLSFNPSNNRITTSGYSYDDAGNLLTDGAHSYTYDAENKVKTVDGTAAYVYDGEGQRVRKLVGENLRFVYDMQGKEVAEFDGANGTLQKEYIYGASGLLATIAATGANAVQYLTADHLGSPRVVTTDWGQLVSRHDYLPFGEELFAGQGGRTAAQGYSPDGIRQKFTQKERDIETGLDYFGARYYGSTQGQFTSPDPLITSAKVGVPQSWNRYTYCLNNPLAFIDPTGLEWRTNDKTNALTWYEKDDDRTGTTEYTSEYYQHGDQWVHLNMSGPTHNAEDSDFARRGWDFAPAASVPGSYNGANVPSVQAGPGDSTGALQLLFEYITGTGPTDRDFGPSDYMTQGMMTSPDVAAARQKFIDQGGGTYVGGERFGLNAEDGPFEARANMPRQFVGSFNVTITQKGNGDAQFVLENATTLKSALYQTPGVQPVERSTMHPLSTKTQTYFWTERGVIKP